MYVCMVVYYYRMYVSPSMKNVGGPGSFVRLMYCTYAGQAWKCIRLSSCILCVCVCSYVRMYIHTPSGLNKEMYNEWSSMALHLLTLAWLPAVLPQK